LLLIVALIAFCVARSRPKDKDASTALDALTLLQRDSAAPFVAFGWTLCAIGLACLNCKDQL
jgi:hypothetical protein